MLREEEEEVLSCCELVHQLHLEAEDKHKNWDGN